jgi:hypothetical protein
MTTPNPVTWAEIEAEAEGAQQGYRERLVEIFRRHEGQTTDEKDAQGRVVKVTIASFARHVGVPVRTFDRWVKDVRQTVTAEQRGQADHAAVRLATSRMASTDKAKLAVELAQDPDVAEEVSRSLVDNPDTEATVKRAVDESRASWRQDRPAPEDRPARRPGVVPTLAGWFAASERIGHAIEDVRDADTRLRDLTLDDEQRGIVVDQLAELITETRHLSETVSAGSLDDELARLTGSGS